MKTTKQNLKVAVFMCGVSVCLLVFCSFEKTLVSGWKTLIEAVGTSLMVTSVTYIILYYNEYRNLFYEAIAEMLYENTMLSDYLADFAFDMRYIVGTFNRFQRIEKLYEDVHGLKMSGFVSEHLNFSGKRKEVMDIAFIANGAIYVEFMDYLVEQRNLCVRMKNMNKKEMRKFRQDTGFNIEDYFDEVIYNAKLFQKKFFDIKTEVQTKSGIEYVNKTEYNTPIE